MFDRDLMQTYLNYNQTIGSTKRYGKCPFCGTVKRLGFVVTRTNTGFICWCHGCHKSYGIGGAIPPRKECLRVSGELKARMIQNPRKRVPSVNTQTITKSSVYLPMDITDELPTSALVWLRLYGITQQEIQKYGFCWSPKYDRLVLPVRDENGRLVYWQGRYFGLDKRQSKYINTKSSRGNIWFDTGGDFPITVLVEDILSAIAISRTGKARAIALLGSFISDNLIVKLLSEDRQVCVWLDRDKRCDALVFTKRLNVFGITAKTVSTVKDPKCYKPSTICKELRHAFPQLFNDDKGNDLRPLFEEVREVSSSRGASWPDDTDQWPTQKLRNGHSGLASSENPCDSHTAFPEAEIGDFCLLQRGTCVPERQSLHHQVTETFDLILERILVAGYILHPLESTSRTTV